MKNTTTLFPTTEYVFEPENGSRFEMKIGGTIYEITTHFNPEGRQSVLEQFRDLLLRESWA